jgi:hypothetical protein
MNWICKEPSMLYATGIQVRVAQRALAEAFARSSRSNAASRPAATKELAARSANPHCYRRQRSVAEEDQAGHGQHPL